MADPLIYIFIFLIVHIVPQSSHTTSRCDITIVNNELKKYLVARVMCDTIYSLTKDRDEDLVKTAIMTTSTNRSKEKIYIDDSYDKDHTV